MKNIDPRRSIRLTNFKIEEKQCKPSYIKIFKFYLYMKFFHLRFNVINSNFSFSEFALFFAEHTHTGPFSKHFELFLLLTNKK